MPPAALPSVPDDTALRLAAHRAAVHRARRHRSAVRRSALLLTAAPPLVRR